MARNTGGFKELRAALMTTSKETGTSAYSHQELSSAHLPELLDEDSGWFCDTLSKEYSHAMPNF
jgi:hypothetical protein